MADPCGSAVKVVGPKPLDFWDRGFESKLRGCVLVCGVCCVLYRHTHLRQADHLFRGVLLGVCVCVCVSMCDLGTLQWGGLGPIWAAEPQKIQRD